MIAWIDNNYPIRKVMPNQGSELAKGGYLGISAHELLAARKAQQQPTASVSIPLSSIQNWPGLGIYVVIFEVLQLNKELQGFITSLLLYDEYINTVLFSYLLVEHRF